MEPLCSSILGPSDIRRECNGVRGTRTGRFGPEVTQQFALDFVQRHQDGPCFPCYPMIAAHGPLEPLPGPRRGPGTSAALVYDRGHLLCWAQERL